MGPDDDVGETLRFLERVLSRAGSDPSPVSNVQHDPNRISKRRYSASVELDRLVGRELAAGLRNLRLRQRLTQAQAAELFGVPRPSWTRLEAGKHTMGLATFLDAVRCLRGDVLGELSEALQRLDAAQARRSGPASSLARVALDAAQSANAAGKQLDAPSMQRAAASERARANSARSPWRTARAVTPKRTKGVQ